jgi:peptide subunit release factor RF-3
MRHVAQAGAEPIIAMTPAVGFAALDTEASCSIVHALELEEALEEALAAQQFVLLLNQATSSSREPAQVLRLQYESALPHLVISPELGSVYFSSALRSAAVSQIDEERSEAAPEPEPEAAPEPEPEPEPEPDASGIVGSAAVTPVTQPM